MKKSIIALGMLIFLVLTSGCQKEIGTFIGSSSVYFDVIETKPGFSGISDSSYVTFAYDLEEKKDTIISLTVRVSGMPVDIDRSITIRVNQDKSSLVEGVDYKLANNAFILPMDSIRLNIPVTLNRTKKLKEEEGSLTLDLVENEYFDLGINSTINSLGEEINLISHTITVSDLMTEPSNWITQSFYFGDFSRKKLNLMSDLTGYSLLQLVGNLSVAQMQYVGSVTKEYLNQMANDGNIVYEEDNKTVMEVGRYIL